MKIKFTVGIIAIICLALGVVYYVSTMKPADQISAEQAFQAIRGQPFLQGVAMWNDALQNGFQADEPRVQKGQAIIGELSKPMTGMEFASGALANISPRGEYWLFSWFKPGVIDQRDSFYVDAKTGAFVLSTKYSSPD